MCCTKGKEVLLILNNNVVVHSGFTFVVCFFFFFGNVADRSRVIEQWILNILRFVSSNEKEDS